MRLNNAQKAIVVVSVIVLLCLALFPPWQQANERETSYRKDIGRGFVLRPPGPVAVDCYFEGCKIAPPSYFHVLLYRELLLSQLLSVFGVAVVALWMFRSRRDGTCARLISRRTRLEFSMLTSLLVPTAGTFPLAVVFLDILLEVPKQVIRVGNLGLWLMPMAMGVVVFSVSSLIVYLSLSLALWIAGVRADQGA